MPFWILTTVLGSALTWGAALAEPQDELGAQRHGEEETAAVLPLCPVMGEPINLAMSVATDDGPVFFCCKKCISKYQENFAKYAAEVTGQRQALASRPKVQVTCPVSGKPVDRKVFAEGSAPKVYFCCEGCISKFEREPKKYRQALANSYTYQTRCPVMGEDIDPEAFTTLADGRKIYFCCPRCDKKLLGNPSKYLANLEAQGFTIKPAEVTHGQKGEHKDDHDHGSHGDGHHDHDH